MVDFMLILKHNIDNEKKRKVIFVVFQAWTGQIGQGKIFPWAG